MKLSTGISTAAFLLASAAAFAQNSEVSGRVVDSSKSVVFGAHVTLTRTETGDRRETDTSSDGYYRFPLLTPGIYALVVEKQGFQTGIHSGIKVETGLIANVDVELPVGSVSESINIEATAPQLQTESASVATLVENKTIANMPLIDRRAAQLQRLSGFVVQNGTGSGATFAIAGGRGNNANYMIDGGAAQNLTLGVPTLSFDPPVESMQEFNVAISNYAAELGRTGGGVIQMTTKSGTNDFHGSAYEYFRNDVLNARTFFASSIPALRYNLFGASLGGPVQKNRTMFFFNYEGRRQTSSTTRILNVPTQAEAQGDFSADTYTVRDPATGAAFPGNQIPASRLDPVGAKLAAFYAAPNVPGAASGKGNFRINNPATTTVNGYVTRIDHIFSDNDRVFGRFLSQIDNTKTASVFPVPGTDSFGLLQDNYYYNASATWYHNFTPALINEARYTFSQRKAFYISAGVGSEAAKSLSLAGVNPDYFPTVNVNGLQALGNTSQQQRLQAPIRSDQLADTLTLIRGKHQFKAGAEYRYSRNLDKYSPSAGGSFTFTNQATGSSLASLLLGWVNSANVLDTYPLETRADTYAAFVQDDWRITPNLTLNIGLRWDIDQPRWETSNRQNSFDPLAANPVAGVPGVITFSGRGGLNKFANNWDLNNFGPRLGIAWKLRDGWVVRGGGAVLYLGEYDQATPIVANTGFSTQGNFVSPDNGVTPAFLLAGGVPSTASPAEKDLTAVYGAVKPGQSPTTAVAYFNPNRVNGYLYQASLNLQHQLTNSLMLEAGYLGTFGHHLAAPDARSINQVPSSLLGPGNAQVLRPFPQFSNVSIIADDVGNSNYHGLNIGVDKRYSKGLLFKANYTFSKMIDDLDSRNELAGYPGVNAFADYYNRRADRGLSGNDIRHRLIVASVYEFPVGRGKRFGSGSRWINNAIGGWSTGIVAEFRTGTPLSPVMLTNDTNSFSDSVRPDVAGDPSLSGGRIKGEQIARWFNTGAFVSPARYRFGNAGRTFGEGPGAINVDASLLKDFRVAERTSLQFRAEALNILNHANFANPDTRVGSATFGQITSLVSGNQSRIIQIGLHLKF